MLGFIMGRKSWFVSVSAVLLGMAAVSQSSLAFQLNPEDKRVDPGDTPAMTLPMAEESHAGLDAAPGIDLGKAQSVRQGPVAAAPPLRLQPGAVPRWESPNTQEHETVIIGGTTPEAHDDAPARAGPSALATSASITGVRLGGHPDKTRVVLDLNGKTDFSYGVSDAGTSVIISFSGVEWRPERPSRRRQGVVSGYSFARDAGGEGQFGIDTTIPVRIKKVFALPPQNGKGHRIVLDLAEIRDPDRSLPNTNLHE